MLRRLLLALTLLALSTQAWAQRGNIFSTKGQKEFESALTAGGIFGVPRSTTALLPTCATANTGAVRFDTTTSTLKYCSGSAWVAPGGVAAGDNTAWLGTNSFIDGSFSIIGSSTATKIAKFEVDGLSVGTRTYTLPDASITIAGLSAQTFAGLQTFGGGGKFTTTTGLTLDEDVPLILSTQNKIIQSSVQTNRAIQLGTDNGTGNAVLVHESADVTFNFAHAAATDPTLFIHSHNQSTTEYLGFYHDGTQAVFRNGTTAYYFFAAGNSPRFVSGNGDFTFSTDSSSTVAAKVARVGSTIVYGTETNNAGSDQAGNPVLLQGGRGSGAGAGGNVSLQTAPALATGSTAQALSDRGVVVAKAKALTAAAATSFVRISLAALSMAGGVVEYSIQASDGTDMQSLSGLLPFSVVNKAGVETCTIGATSTQNETLVAASAVSTLTNTFTCDTSPTNGVDLQANAVSSLTETTLQIVYQIRLNGAVGTTTITPQ